MIREILIYPFCITILVTRMKEKIDVEKMVFARRARGMEILESGIQPREVGKETWIIPSQSGNGTYTVEFDVDEWHCSCPDFQYRGIECKHIHAVKIWKALKNKFQQLHLKVKQTFPAKEETPVLSCKFCHSPNIIKYGEKNGKQNYLCKDCGRKFVNNIDFENMKYNPKIIALTMDLYFKGVSLRKIAHHLKQFYNLNISHKTVHNWIEKYVGIMNTYVNTLNPEIGNIWHADEMMVNVARTWEYLWNVMDEETRFQLASVISKERKIEDARRAFQNAKKNVGGRKPKYIVTDGLQSYNRAVRKEFHTKIKETVHIKGVGLRHQRNNNHVERLHGTIREREKTMRAIKTEKTPIIEGHRIYYNFIKPHESLNDKTPAEIAGITIEGNENQWLNLMRKAIEYQKKMEVAQ